MNSCLPTTSSTMNQPPLPVRQTFRSLLSGDSPEALRMAATWSPVSWRKAGCMASPGAICAWACSTVR